MVYQKDQTNRGFSSRFTPTSVPIIIKRIQRFHLFPLITIQFDQGKRAYSDFESWGNLFIYLLTTVGEISTNPTFKGGRFSFFSEEIPD